MEPCRAGTQTLSWHLRILEEYPPGSRTKIEGKYTRFLVLESLRRPIEIGCATWNKQNETRSWNQQLATTIARDSDRNRKWNNNRPESFSFLLLSSLPLVPLLEEPNKEPPDKKKRGLPRCSVNKIMWYREEWLWSREPKI